MMCDNSGQKRNNYDIIWQEQEMDGIDRGENIRVYTIPHVTR